MRVTSTIKASLKGAAFGTLVVLGLLAFFQTKWIGYPDYYWDTAEMNKLYLPIICGLPFNLLWSIMVGLALSGRPGTPNLLLALTLLGVVVNWMLIGAATGVWRERHARRYSKPQQQFGPATTPPSPRGTPEPPR